VKPFRRRTRPPAAPLLCRWDLDKTYLRSEFDTLRQLWRTARERGEDKVEVPGVIELLKGLRASADRRGRSVRIYFISASPPQIGQAIRDKLGLDRVPYDGIVFKDQLQLIRRGKFGKLREHVGFKLCELFRGRARRAPETRELLFGDDWESDPLTYSIYAEVIAGVLPLDALGPLLQRIGVDPEVIPEARALAAPVAGLGGVERICINLERRSAPASFALYGPRVVPTFNYFQTAVVLAADGWLDPEDVAAVAGGLAERAGYTPRRLENSLADPCAAGCSGGAGVPPDRSGTPPGSFPRVRDVPGWAACAGCSPRAQTRPRPARSTSTRSSSGRVRPADPRRARRTRDDRGRRVRRRPRDGGQRRRGPAHRSCPGRRTARRMRERARPDAIDLSLAGGGRGSRRASAGREGARRRPGRARRACPRAALLRRTGAPGVARHRRLGGLP
jgi:hypothetical protein